MKCSHRDDDDDFVDFCPILTKGDTFMLWVVS
jgi:hypothetical protein